MADNENTDIISPRAAVEVRIDMLPAEKVAEVHLLAECVGRAISVGLADGFKQVLASPEMGMLLKKVTEGGAVTGILQGLAAADGRKSLDARTMKQNGLEMVYAIREALNKLTEAQQQEARETADVAMVDPEQQYLEWKKSRER